MRNIVFKNTAANSVQFVYTAAIVLIMTPLYVRILGDYDYGIWQILAALLGYANLFDLGFKPTVSRFVARFVGRDQRSRIPLLIGTAASIVFLMSLIPAAGFAAWATFSPIELDGDPAASARYRWVLFIVSCTVPVAFLNYLMTSIVEGFQAYTIRTVVHIVGSLVFVTTFVTVHNAVDPLLLMASMGLLVAFGKVVVLGFCVNHIVGRRVRLLPLRYSPRLGKRLVRFGSKSFAQGLSSTTENRMDTLIVGSVLGPASVVFYSLAQVLTSYIRSVGATLSHAFLPALSSMRREKDRDAMYGLVRAGGQLTIGVMTPFAVGVIGLGDIFLELWIGSKYADRAGALVTILGFYAVLPILTPMANRYFTAVNEHGFLAVVAFCRVSANLVLSLALLPAFGLVGVAVGSLVPELVARLVILRRFLMLLDVSLERYVREMLAPVLLPAVAMVTTLIIVRGSFPLDGWANFIAAGGCASFVYAIFAFRATREQYQRAKAIAH